MGKKTIVVILIVLIAILGLVAIYYVEEFPDKVSGNLTELAVYSEGPTPLSVIISDIENGSYYQGYDNDTVNWMKSLGDKSVFSGDGIFVIMSNYDASKIPTVYATDVIITEIVECNILETRSLGDVDYQRDVFLVDNVKYLRQNITEIYGGGA